ncbi:MAG: glycosyltransferase family 39 protein [Elusimicrobia bacterium]|nr:glycosyltransferase family 39 protein [Elusimicrobiota bacterium]
MKKNFLIIFSIFLFSVLVQIKGITNPLLDFHAWRQTQTAMTIRNYYENGFKFFYPQVDWVGQRSVERAGTEFPVYSYLVALLYKVFGQHDILGRFLAVFFSASGAAYLFLLLKKFISFRSAYVSSLIFSVIPIKIYFTRTIQPESIMLFATISGLYYFVCYLENTNRKSYLLFSLFFLVLAPLVKLPSLYILLPIAYLAYQKWGWKFLYRIDVWCYNILLILCVGLWYKYTKSGIRILPLEFNSFLDMLSVIKQPDFWARHFLSRFIELTTTYVGLFFFAVGLWVVVLKNRKFFFALWFTAVIIYIILIGRYGYIHQYTSLPYAPINAVFIGCGIVYFWEKYEQRGVLNKLIIAFFVLVIPINSFIRIHNWYKMSDVWLLRAEPIVAKLSASNDLFLCNTKADSIQLYHIHRKGLTVDLRKTDLIFQNVASQGISFFLTGTDDYWPDDSETKKLLLKNYLLAWKDKDFLIFDLRKRK